MQNVDKEAVLRKTSEDLKAYMEYCKQEAMNQAEIPQYIQLELDFMDDMFMKRMEDPRA